MPCVFDIAHGCKYYILLPKTVKIIPHSLHLYTPPPPPTSLKRLPVTVLMASDRCLIRNSTRGFTEFSILSSVADGMEDRHFSVEDREQEFRNLARATRTPHSPLPQGHFSEKMSFRSIILSRKRPTTHTRTHTMY